MEDTVFGCRIYSSREGMLGHWMHEVLQRLTFQNMGGKPTKLPSQHVGSNNFLG
jgi:hypothetical protein